METLRWLLSLLPPPTTTTAINPGQLSKPRPLSSYGASLTTALATAEAFHALSLTWTIVLIPRLHEKLE